MYDLAAELYPICRSITGDGFRRTLDIIERHMALQRVEVPTGTRVFDWEVPKEWNVSGAWIKDPSGRVIVDFANHNLHLLNYSAPFRGTISRTTLLEHLYSLPEHPDWIPYRTSYYEEKWGFCVPHTMLESLPEGDYEVCVDTRLEDGHLTYAEAVVPGRSEREVLISCHACHPSLANDNLSSLAVAVQLHQALERCENRFTYRFLIVPGTIGSISWLARNESMVGKIDHGLVLACLGDRGCMTYKKSRRGDATVDRAVALAFSQTGQECRTLEFDPYGYDERQYCSPGFDLPVGRLSRTPHGMFPEYHTSADNLEFIAPEMLADSLASLLEILGILESDRTMRNTNPKCEPQLGRRGIYAMTGGLAEPGVVTRAMLWVLNLSDGEHSLIDIAERSAMDFEAVREATRILEENGLLVPAAGRARREEGGEGEC
jgi:aminopeptidase-like protein